MRKSACKERAIFDEIVNVYSILLRLLKLIGVSFLWLFIATFIANQTHETIRYHAHAGELASYIIYLHACEIILDTDLLYLLVLHKLVAHIFLQNIGLSLRLFGLFFLFGMFLILLLVFLRRNQIFRHRIELRMR